MDNIDLGLQFPAEHLQALSIPMLTRYGTAGDLAANLARKEIRERLPQMLSAFFTDSISFLQTLHTHKGIIAGESRLSFIKEHTRNAFEPNYQAPSH